MGMALRITVQERESSIEVTLEGRLAGPWVAELSKAWREAAPRLESRSLSLNLRDLTSWSEDGKQVLREIVAQASPEILTRDPVTRHLAQEIGNALHPGTKTVLLNLRDLIYAKEDDMALPREIVAQNCAEIPASDPVQKYVAQEIRDDVANCTEAEAVNGIDA